MLGTEAPTTMTSAKTSCSVCGELIADHMTPCATPAASPITLTSATTCPAMIAARSGSTKSTSASNSPATSASRPAPKPAVSTTSSTPAKPPTPAGLSEAELIAAADAGALRHRKTASGDLPLPARRRHRLRPAAAMNARCCECGEPIGRRSALVCADCGERVPLPRCSRQRTRSPLRNPRDRLPQPPRPRRRSPLPALRHGVPPPLRGALMSATRKPQRRDPSPDRCSASRLLQLRPSRRPQPTPCLPGTGARCRSTLPSLGGFLGLYMGLIAGAIGNSTITIVSVVFALLLGLAFSRVTSRFLMSRRWIKPARASADAAHGRRAPGGCGRLRKVSHPFDDGCRSHFVSP